MLRLRDAQPADALAVALVHVRSWQVAYRGLLADAYLDSLKPEDRAARYTFASPDRTQPATIVALEDDRICGFATTAPAQDADAAGKGELMALYVDPLWLGRGVGALLIKAARHRLVARGFHEAVLWVMVGNQRALRFYELDGWRPDGTRRTAEVWGVAVDELRLARAIARE
jgi:GNAT superfamily N-acetyltransferase